jgi:hypothetical protein
MTSRTCSVGAPYRRRLPIDEGEYDEGRAYWGEGVQSSRPYQATTRVSAMSDIKITYPGLGAAIHALNDRAKAWLDEYADGIPIRDGMMVEIGYLPDVIEAALAEGFVVADDDAD